MSHRGVLYLLITALALLASPALTPRAAAATTYVVDDDSPSCMGGPPDAPTLTGALALPPANGDTIHVCAGDYTESSFIIDKSLTITGPGATPEDDGVATVHHNGGLNPIFTISADGVTLEGLDLDATPPSGFGSFTGGIWFTGSYVTIQDNEIRNGTAPTGGTVSGNGGNVNILRNYVHDNDHGIVCQCDDSGLWSNTVDGDRSDALSLIGDRGTIAGNVVTNGTVDAAGNDLLVENNQISAGTAGSALYVSGNPVTVTNNALSDADYYGIQVYVDVASSTTVTIGHNTFTQINTPIYLYDSDTTDAFTLNATIGGSPSEANTFVNSGGTLGDMNYLVGMDGPTANVNAEHNDWGLCTTADIEQEIHHQVDDPAQGLVDFEPFIAPGSCAASTPTPPPTPTATATPMPPATGQMYFCPEAGKWSVATSSGPDATPIETALASCPTDVDAAYRIDPNTQAWTRYFRGRPEISNLATIDNGQGIIALGAGMAAASATSAQPLRAAANGMPGCPQSGKWAISVWTGMDGTPPDQALASCGSPSVAAAYWIDPQAQAWKRYFEGRPEISNLTILDHMQGILTLGAGGATPSAARIAFVSDRGGNDEIYVMDADGSSPTRLTQSGGSHPAWSPDGSKIAFVSDRDGNDEIYAMNADGSDQTRLTNNSALDIEPAWSPDGSKITFASNRNGLAYVLPDIYVMNADGSNQTNLTNNTAADFSPAWSPDGSKIAFVSSRDSIGDMYVMNADGSDQTRLTDGADAPGYLAWSPDGTRIAFGGPVFGSDVVGPTDIYGDIYIVNADGSGQTNLTNSPSLDEDPTWSPDGSKIAFASIHDGNSEIYVMNADGSDQTNLTNNSASDFAPAWSP